MTLIDLRGRGVPSRRELLDVLPRATFDVAGATEQVAPILADVRARGAAALLDACERFDGVRPAHLRVPAPVLAAALDTLDPAVRAGLAEAIERVRRVHADQVPPERTTTLAPGATVAQRWVPVRRVGLYVPGGLAVYPSSVVMNVVTAQAAGVESLAVASPPQRDFDGLPHPTILACCALLGVSEVYAVGGAQAIAMFAYGAADGETELCEGVDVVTGPGNIWVTAAKRLVNGVVGIDAEAGPTEIAVLADDTADPTWVAADLISQAEHDPLAASVLITDSPELALAVQADLPGRVAAARHTGRITTALSGTQSAVVLVDDMEAGLALADAYGAEHLEIHTRDAAGLASRVHNAGAVFVGPWAPVPLGDYVAGSNHVLPTSGSARFTGGLSVMAYLKSMQVVTYDALALAQVAGHVQALSAAEDLPAHGQAVAARG